MEWQEDEDNVLMESKRVPSSTAAVVESPPIATASSNLENKNSLSSQKQLTDLLAEAREQNMGLGKRVKELEKELE